MSEYQDYRWSCVNRSLSRADAKQVGQLSSHIDVTAHSAHVDYSYGDFKHDPIKILDSYFDVFTYEANWGSQTVAFRFDIGTVDSETLALFAHGDTLTITRTKCSIIVEASYWDEDSMGSHWIPDDYDEDRFHRIYRDILNGDFRALFLLWLKSSSHCEEDTKIHSAPVPQGLSNRHSEHDEMAEFIGLDPDLIEASAQLTPTLQTVPNLQPDFQSLLNKLPAQRMREILSDLLSGDTESVARSLKKELTSLAPKQAKKPTTHELVPFKEIEKLAADLKEARENKAREEEQRSKDVYLKSLAQYEAKIWRLAESLIREKKTKAYDQAVEFFCGLRELYEHRSKTDLFVEKVTEFIEAFPTLGGMRRRMEDAGHLSTDSPTARKLTSYIERQQTSPTTKRQQFIDDLLAEIADRSL